MMSYDPKNDLTAFLTSSRVPPAVTWQGTICTPDVDVELSDKVTGTGRISETWQEPMLALARIVYVVNVC